MFPVILVAFKRSLQVTELTLHNMDKNGTIHY